MNRSDKNLYRIKNLCKAFVIVLALTMDLDIQEGTTPADLLLKSMNGTNLLYVLLFVLAAAMLFYADKIQKEAGEHQKTGLSGLIPALFFAFCMVFGYSFYRSNSWDLIFASHVQMLKSLIAFCGYACIFYAVIICIFHAADRLELQEKKDHNGSHYGKILGWYVRRLESTPFRTAFLTLFIVFLPDLILSFPGIFTCDTKIQLDNGYAALIYGTALLRNQHPVIHTLLLVGASLFGNAVFSSADAGLFLVSLAQTLLTIGAVAWTVRYLAKLSVSPGWLVAVLAFFALNPRIHNYMTVLVKDVWYAPFLMIFVVELHRLLAAEHTGDAQKERIPVLLVLSVIGIFFFRQDGIYVLLLTTLAAGILCKYRRKLFLTFFVASLVFSVFYQNILLPACNVDNNNTRQMFSIPFQQTARYVKEAGEDVTEKEAEAIAAVIDYERLAELYNPNLSDPVKSTFNRDASMADIAAYLKVWAQMFFRHPDIYVQATMNNLYGYFYPAGYTTMVQDFGSSQEYMQECSDHNTQIHIQIGHPEALSALREKMEFFREMLFKLPVLSACNLSATYIWILLLLICYGFRNKNKAGLLLLLPLFVVFLVCMAGPVYGWYFRYMYSIVMCLPAAGLCQGLFENR